MFLPIFLLLIVFVCNSISSNEAVVDKDGSVEINHASYSTSDTKIIRAIESLMVNMMSGLEHRLENRITVEMTKLDDRMTKLDDRMTDLTKIVISGFDFFHNAGAITAGF